MHRRAAFPLANLLSDLPFSAVCIFTYNVTIYFMTGLHRSAGAFWTFRLTSYTTYLSMQGFFRTFGLCFLNFDAAFRVVVLFVPNIIQYSGYLIPESLMRRWLFCIYYINPFSYSWAGLMESEFSRISLVCKGSFVVPCDGPDMDKSPMSLGLTKLAPSTALSQDRAPSAERITSRPVSHWMWTICGEGTS